MKITELIKGNWYKVDGGNFSDFDYFLFDSYNSDKEASFFSAKVDEGKYSKEEDWWGIHDCTFSLMTDEEKYMFLPQGSNLEIARIKYPENSIIESLYQDGKTYTVLEDTVFTEESDGAVWCNHASDLEQFWLYEGGVWADGKPYPYSGGITLDKDDAGTTCEDSLRSIQLKYNLAMNEIQNLVQEELAAEFSNGITRIPGMHNPPISLDDGLSWKLPADKKKRGSEKIEIFL
jgi:hypothetical protein